MSTMTCRDCNKSKDLSDFSSYDIDKRNYLCKECKKAKTRDRVQNRKALAIKLREENTALFCCTKCKEVKRAAEFNTISIQNYDYICSVCRTEREIERQKNKKNKSNQIS